MLKLKTMEKEETFDSEELIYQLRCLCSDRQFKKPKPLPRFTINEALFIRDLIFLKPRDIVYFYIADHIRLKAQIEGIHMFNSISYRRYNFIWHFLECKGNATKAAILAGYSPRSAKQQAHRILKQTQGHFFKPGK